VAPSRLPGIKTPGQTPAAEADATKSHGKKVSEAKDSATKKAAS
jgi:hypothetical protein